MKHSIVKTLAALAALILTALPLSAAEVVTYYHNDHLGSPIAATDDTGTVVWQQAYDPWGEPVTTTANSRAYTGKWRDLETGLNDYSARWQSSSIGRFTQIDKAPWHEGNIHSFNRYAYANNSPYRYKDPDGNIPVDTIWDAANVLYDGARIIYGHATGNSGVVAEANTDMAVDLAAMFVPYVPAGSSKLARMGGDAESIIRGKAKASDGLGNLLNSSQFDRLLRSKGRALQFHRQGSASKAFDQLRRDFGVSADNVVHRPGGVRTFRSDNRTFTLRSDSKAGKTVSVATDNNSQQIVIRFGKD